jgi:hypothetical protein
MECEQLVRQAAAGKVKAFVELTGVSRPLAAICPSARSGTCLACSSRRSAGPLLHCSWSWRRPVIAFVLMSLCDHRSSERVESGTRRLVEGVKNRKSTAVKKHMISFRLTMAWLSQRFHVVGALDRSSLPAEGRIARGRTCFGKTFPDFGKIRVWAGRDRSPPTQTR